MSLLKLAKAVYGEAAHVGPHYDIPACGPVTYTDCAVRIATDNGIDPFTPRTNPAQFVEVLCWLLEADKQGKQIAVTNNTVRCWTYDEDGEDVLCWNTWHTNTPDSIMRAVVEAAERVAEGIL